MSRVAKRRVASDKLCSTGRHGPEERRWRMAGAEELHDEAERASVVVQWPRWAARVLKRVARTASKDGPVRERWPVLFRCGRRERETWHGDG